MAAAPPTERRPRGEAHQATDHEARDDRWRRRGEPRRAQGIHTQARVHLPQRRRGKSCQEKRRATKEGAGQALQRPHWRHHYRQHPRRPLGRRQSAVLAQTHMHQHRHGSTAGQMQTAHQTPLMAAAGRMHRHRRSGRGPCGHCMVQPPEHRCHHRRHHALPQRRQQSQRKKQTRSPRSSRASRPHQTRAAGTRRPSPAAATRHQQGPQQRRPFSRPVATAWEQPSVAWQTSLPTSCLPRLRTCPPTPAEAA